MGAALLFAAVAPANAQGSPVSRQKNVELNNVAENQGNYDSPPVTQPSTFSTAGYDQCLVALGTTYCRAQQGQWSAVTN
jgi:hypothetical protein